MDLPPEGFSMTTRILADFTLLNIRNQLSLLTTRLRRTFTELPTVKPLTRSSSYEFVRPRMSGLSVVSSKKPETTVTLLCRPTAEEQNRINIEIELNWKKNNLQFPGQMMTHCPNCCFSCAGWIGCCCCSSAGLKK